MMGNQMLRANDMKKLTLLREPKSLKVINKERRRSQDTLISGRLLKEYQ